MEKRRHRVSVANLRTSNATTLLVLTQDVLNLPIGQIEPRTLVDLLALSEIGDELPVGLASDLVAFREQSLRQMDDLPDGPGLAGFLDELCEIDAELAPQCLREAVARLAGKRRHPDVADSLRELLAHWEGRPPALLTLPAGPSAGAPESEKPRHSARATTRSSATAARTPKRRPSTSVDSRRAEWIQEDVVSRLEKYLTNGLKEEVLVAGARHRAPWKDLTEAEVRTVLRRLRRDGRLRYSAGRWLLEG